MNAEENYLTNIVFQLIYQVVQRHVVGGHHKHLGNVIGIDNADFTGVQPHIGGINNQHTLRTQLADGDNIVLRRATAVDDNPVALRICSTHFSQQRARAVIAHHAVTHT